MNQHIPPLRRPEDIQPIRSQTDLHQHWRALMGPLGFSQAALWVQFLAVDDLAWARGLLSAARKAGVPCEPIHLANDEAVRVFAPDDLALPGSAA